ncbi:MAG: LolA family protein [Terriglobales bacterium]
MRKASLVLVACAALAFAAFAQTAIPIPLRQAVETLDGRYNSIRTWQADFTQTYTSGLQQQTQSGHLFLEKPGRMCWIYVHPRRKVFLVSGKRVWQYAAGDDEATVMQVSKLSDLRTPLRFLLGHTDLPKELRHLSYSGLIPWHAGDFVIQGQPLQTAATAGWRALWIEFTPTYRIVRLLIAGLDGSRNDIRFEDIQVNTPLPPQTFRLHLPPGVKIVNGG